MAESFYASVNYVREAIMRRWLVFHAILLSLTLLLYKNVIAALLHGDSHRRTRELGVIKILNSTETDCKRVCYQEPAIIECQSFQFVNISRICLLYNFSPAYQMSEHLLEEHTVREHGTDLAVRLRRNAFNEGLEENVDKLWHDLEKYQSDKHALQQFEKLVVQELKIKSEEIEGLKSAKRQQSEEISQLKQAMSKLLSQNARVQEKLEDLKTKQTNQQHQISGLEFSDEKLTAGMGKLIVQTGELEGKIGSLSKENTETKEKLTDVEKVTQQLEANVATLLEEQKLVHDVVERIALLAEKTSVISDRLHALQEHQTVSEKEISGLKATMERLVASMRAVDKSQIQVSNHMDTLDYNVSDHDVLMNELLKTQTRDSRVLRKKMDDLMAKSAAQTKAFEDLKAQTSQTNSRFNALTESIAKVSQRNDQLRDKIDQLKETSSEFKAAWVGAKLDDATEIEDLKSNQQALMNQLHKLGNAEVVLASELKRFPTLVNQLADDVRRTSDEQGRREADFKGLKAETDALKLALRNLQVQGSGKPGGSAGQKEYQQSLEDQLELLNMRRGRRDIRHDESGIAQSYDLTGRGVALSHPLASIGSVALSSTQGSPKRLKERRKYTSVTDWRLWSTQHRRRRRTLAKHDRSQSINVTGNPVQEIAP